MGKISFRLAVLAREGRGGGEVPGRLPPFTFWTWVDIGEEAKESWEGATLAAKGSFSRMRGDAIPLDVRECLRALGLGFCNELRTLWPGEASGVFDLWPWGGGGGGLEGVNLSSRRALYS